MHTMGYSVHGKTGTGGDFMPRVNFSSFSSSLLTCFQVMTGEDWSPVMFYYMQNTEYPVFVSFYFVSCFTINNCVLVSLFVAVILENFELQESEKSRIQQERYVAEMQVDVARPGAEMLPNLSEEQAREADEPDDASTRTWFERANAMTPTLCSAGCMESCRKVVENPWFERVIMLFILLSSVSLALE